jgi:hypothetical protein
MILQFRPSLLLRLGTYSPNAATLPAAAAVAERAMVVDPRAEPAYGERVPFVIVAGEPNARLVDKVCFGAVCALKPSSTATASLRVLILPR